MENKVTKKSNGADGSGTSTNAQNLWFIGIAVTVLATLFCFAMFKTKDRPLPVPDAGQGVVVIPSGQQAAMANNFGHPSADQMIAQWRGSGQQVAWTNPNCATSPNYTNCFPQNIGGAQQVALANPNCVTCPNFTNCFPQGTGGAQQVAFANPNCATSPNYANCFPPGIGGAQQVALANPNCVTCPSFTNCFPQGPGGTQPVALGQGGGPIQSQSMMRCPFCNNAYSDSNAGNRGFSRCPYCQGMIPFANQPQSGNLTTVALANPMGAPAWAPRMV